MVPNTSDDLPDPETPVNTVSRRLGIATLMSLRLFSRAPWTRIRSWLSAGCWLEEATFALKLFTAPTLPGRRPGPLLQNCSVAPRPAGGGARTAGRSAPGREPPP